MPERHSIKDENYNLIFENKLKDNKKIKNTLSVVVKIRKELEIKGRKHFINEDLTDQNIKINKYKRQQYKNTRKEKIFYLYFFK